MLPKPTTVGLVYFGPPASTHRMWINAGPISRQITDIVPVADRNVLARIAGEFMNDQSNLRRRLHGQEHIRALIMKLAGERA